MYDLVRQVFGFFSRMGGFGLVGFGILDSSFLFLPLGNDLLMIVLTARKPELFWYYALMSTLGSLIGTAITDALSRKLGEAGMSKIANPRRVQALRERIENKAWWVLSLSALLPPPFPFTLFVIAASGMQMPRWHVLTAVTIGRLTRFLLLGILAARYGQRILQMADRPEIEYLMIALAVASIVGSALSVTKWVQSARRREPRPAFAER